MKAWMLAVLAGATLGTTAVPKDRAAIMYYTGRDSVISLIPAADSANLAMILMGQWQGDSVPVAKLAGRPCLGVALFSRGEWAALAAAGKKPEEVRPSDASWRLRVFPASGSDPIAIQDLASGERYHAVGLDVEFFRSQGAKEVELPLLIRSLSGRLQSLRGACSAE